MIDLEKLYGYKREFEREEMEIKAQMSELERKLVFVKAEISVVDKMIVDEETATAPIMAVAPEINESDANEENGGVAPDSVFDTSCLGTTTVSEENY